MNKRGFTLLELLIVIGILAILGTVTILVLNPAELFRQARDSQRVQNLATIMSALGLYTSTVTSPDLDGSGAYGTMCWVNIATAANCGGRHAALRVTTTVASAAVDGTGWIPVNFTGISSGAPFSAIPVDPINSGVYFFSYAADMGSNVLNFELDAKLESNKYTTGADDRQGTDGGSSTTLYEIGNDPGLDL